MNLLEVRGRLLDLVQGSATEWIDLENALGRVAASPVDVKADLPRSRRSGLDGFAIRSGETQEASPDRPCVLNSLSGALAAGAMTRVALGEGEAVEIFTGAPIPAFADAVVPMEEVIRDGAHIRISRSIRPGEGVRQPGEEAVKGENLVCPGQVLTPTRLAMLATQGARTLKVFSRPRVTLLATGDEVRELGQILKGPWTYCNNRLLMGWLTSCYGGFPIQAGIARDDTGEILRGLHAAEGELVITTGGIGRGGRDFILEAWMHMGVEVICREINLIPGRNSASGHKDRQLFFALPGNPWGAQVVFEELVAPVLRKLQGLDAVQRPVVRATLARTLRKREGFFKAVRGILKTQGRFPSFEPLTGVVSSLFSNLKGSSAFVLVTAEKTELQAGSQVDVFFHDCPLAAYPLLMDSKLC